MTNPVFNPSIDFYLYDPYSGYLPDLTYRFSLTKTTTLDKVIEALHRGDLRTEDDFIEFDFENSQKENKWPHPWDNAWQTDYAIRFDPSMRSLSLSKLGRGWVTFDQYRMADSVDWDTFPTVKF